MELFPFLTFVFAMTATPGPANLTMLAMGQSFGYRGTLRFLAGSGMGFGFINLSVGFGLGILFQSSPFLKEIMKYIGMSYMLYLAYKIIKMEMKEQEKREPLSTGEGILVQLLSPKSWTMSIMAYSQFSERVSLLQFVVIFVVSGLTFHSLWAIGGAYLMGFFREGRVRLAVLSSVVVAMVGTTGYALFLQG